MVKNTWLFENNSRKHQKIKKNKSQEITLKNIDETRTFLFFFDEIEQNELMSNKQKKGCTTLNSI